MGSDPVPSVFPWASAQVWARTAAAQEVPANRQLSATT